MKKILECTHNGKWDIKIISDITDPRGAMVLYVCAKCNFITNDYNIYKKLVDEGKKDETVPKMPK